VRAADGDLKQQAPGLAWRPIDVPNVVHRQQHSASCGPRSGSVLHGADVGGAAARGAGEIVARGALSRQRRLAHVDQRRSARGRAQSRRGRLGRTEPPSSTANELSAAARSRADARFAAPADARALAGARIAETSRRDTDLTIAGEARRACLAEVTAPTRTAGLARRGQRLTASVEAHGGLGVGVTVLAGWAGVREAPLAGPATRRRSLAGPARGLGGQVVADQRAGGTLHAELAVVGVASVAAGHTEGVREGMTSAGGRVGGAEADVGVAAAVHPVRSTTRAADGGRRAAGAVRAGQAGLAAVVLRAGGACSRARGAGAGTTRVLVAVGVAAALLVRAAGTRRSDRALEHRLAGRRQSVTADHLTARGVERVATGRDLIAVIDDRPRVDPGPPQGHILIGQLLAEEVCAVGPLEEDLGGGAEALVQLRTEGRCVDRRQLLDGARATATATATRDGQEKRQGAE